MVEQKSILSKLADWAIILILGAFAVLTFIPYVHIVMGTFSAPQDLIGGKLILWPKNVSLDAIRYIFDAKTISRSLMNSVFITVCGTVINVMFTVLMAYPLAQKDLLFKKQILSVLLFTMVFNAGMIPNYLNVMNLGLVNTYWALILPGAISTYNLIVVKNFFSAIPEEMRESAIMDGCNEVLILLRIILPLAKPVLATIVLMYAVGHWNAYMPSVMYLNDSQKWPMQIILRNIVILSQTDLGAADGNALNFAISPESLKMATIFVATTPILLVYPFLQRYFIKGIMLGSVKG